MTQPLLRRVAAVFLPLLASAMAPAAHPPVTLLDHEGKNVLESGKPVSTMTSCSRCHDTQYIATHSYHVSLGRDERAPTGGVPHGRPWDWSPGAFGRWNPLSYRYLSLPGDSRPDLGTAEWIQGFYRHVGAGPAWLGHGDHPLIERTAPSDADPDGYVIDPSTGNPRPWDWQKSGAVEMNCFLCHTPKPDNQSRIKELQRGRFQWANTATLAGAGLVRQTQDGWAYQRDAFQPDGRLQAPKLGIQGPTSENCGLCHGLTHRGQQPLKMELSPRQWSTATKGQVFSPQRISESAVNVKDKDHLARPWDVHAERLLECASCHFSVNNPAFYEPQGSRPKHLKYEPRRLALSEYVERPSHHFAKGHTSQGTLARRLDGTMRRCEDCHDAAGTHGWLPYPQAHFSRLSCEACHISQVYAPAVRQVDWTLPTRSGEPQIQWRGIEGPPNHPASTVVGFKPVLLPKEDLDGRSRLVPHNLITSWYWVEGGPTPRPVRLADLKAAVLKDGQYHPDVAAALGEVATSATPSRIATDMLTRSVSEAVGNDPVLDSPQKVDAVRKRLEAVGVTQPHIEAEIQPYSLHHGVGPAMWATRKCETCHTGQSRLGEQFGLASYVPGGKMPEPVGGTGLAGQLSVASSGGLVYQPSTRQASLYVLGHDRWSWVNALGGLSLVTVVVGVVIHAGLRIRARRERPSRGIVPSRANPQMESPHP